MENLIVTGCFDILHVGHVRLFEYMKNMYPDSKIYVLLDSDARIQKMKGCDRPINNQHHRKEVLASLRHVWNVFTFDCDFELVQILHGIGPHIRFLGSDYKGKDIIGLDISNKHHFFDRIGDVSTTNIIRDIKNG